MNQQAKFAPFASAQSYEQTLVPRESLPGRAERVASSVKTGAANLVIDNAISPLERLKSVQTQ
ncbi:MAG TPA: hypothetical protein PK765_03295 [bacterium]|nr:hypothetical protein [bacterium]